MYKTLDGLVLVINNGLIIAYGWFSNVSTGNLTFPLSANWQQIVTADVGSGCLSYGASPISNTQFVFYTKQGNIHFRYIATAIV